MNAEHYWDLWPEEAFEGTTQNKQITIKIRKSEEEEEQE